MSKKDTTGELKSKKRKYNEEWEKDHKWLTLKDGACYCKLCNRVISAFKKHNLICHEKSNKHIKKENSGVLPSGALAISPMLKCKVEIDFDGPDEVPEENVSFENKEIIVGKASQSNAINGKVFEFLNAAGFPTTFVQGFGEKSFISKKCNLIPLGWVLRRIATGSFLRRNPGVKEGYRFMPPKLETFFKDDNNENLQWSEEQVIEAKLKIGAVTLGRLEYDIMARMTEAVFEILERAWLPLDYALIDLQIQFGITVTTKTIVLAGMIDSGSWTLWPSSDRRLMDDMLVNFNLIKVTSDRVVDKLDHFLPTSKAKVVIVMGSPSDNSHCEEIAAQCENLGIPTALRICSAHKSTADVLKLMAEYEARFSPVIYIAVASRSNGMGQVLSANTTSPVISCPPININEFKEDIWSSLNTPSGLGCPTVLFPEAAAQHAAAILSLSDSLMFAKLKVRQLAHWLELKKLDQQLCLKFAK